MDKKDKITLNNSGSTIIIVILCIAFISILCTLLLSITVNNLEMKVIGQKAKSNFYNAESAFDEIKVGLEQVTASALKVAYNDVMENYLDKNDDERKKIFADTFISEIVNSLRLVSDSTLTTYDIGTLQGFIKMPSALVDRPDNVGDSKLVRDEVLPGEINQFSTFITLKKIKISYLDSNNYKTTISSDIVINTPDISFNTNSSLTPAFFDYSLIADDMVKLELATDVVVSGNIYAGNIKPGTTSVDNSGILISLGSNLKIINATQIVTRSDIIVASHSSLNIIDNPMIWTKNIATIDGAIGGTTQPTEIAINGICYVADDLMLNANNSKVAISGEYYGYSYGANKLPLTPGVNPAGDSSAIIINGTNAILDLSSTNKLLLAGRAYLDPKSQGQATDPVYIQDNVQTGESIAIKGNQNAYLVPGECMPSGFSTNPLTLSDYKTAFDLNPTAVNMVNYTNYSMGDKKLSDYADGCLKIFYNVSTTEQYVYYYLKFNSEQKANEYLQKYYEVNNVIAPGKTISLIDEQMGNNATSISIHSPLYSILSTGNLFEFNSGKSKLNANNVNPDSPSEGAENVSLDAIKKVADVLVKRYDAIQKTLIDTSTRAFDENSVFNSIVMKDNILADVPLVSGNTIEVKSITVGDNIVYIVNNAGGEAFVLKEDNLLVNNGLKGIVVATGSVNVIDNYNGLILSGDQIKLNAGVKINELNAAHSIITSIFGANRLDVNHYFRDYESLDLGSVGTDNESIIVSNLVVYENWKKNEE